MISLKRIYYSSMLYRHKSCLGFWNEDLNTDIKKKIEQHWVDEVAYEVKADQDTKSYYVLPMFPYPSGILHMGHVRVYSLSDTIARIQKLSGNNVIHPIGWDSFGLPAENAAIERNILPDQWTNDNIKYMKKQLKLMGFHFDWSRELSTCDPNYYKWTQYIFIKLFERGLAYQNKALVNWDPVDNTVLADEQVDDNGCSWRSGVKVEKKVLTQWFIKTTKYAKKLYDGLNKKTLENWKDIINLQKHWIGECNGVVLPLQIRLKGKQINLDVWTSEPYKFIHGSFVTVSKQNVIIQDLLNSQTEFIVFNPVTETEIPIFVSDDAVYPDGRDIYLACPQFDERDRILAEALNIKLKNVNNNINVEQENKKALEIILNEDVGGYFVSSKLKDWLISRQRYWGTPIPIIHCKTCGPVPVPVKDLPVLLPIPNSTGIQSLIKLDEWVNCKCPKCKSNAKRETDTMDTFVDSSWYYYRFLDPDNKTMPFEKQKLTGNIPVHVYIGGKEHAVLHLYYARFMSYFLHSLGWTTSEEPFKKLLVQGMIMGQSYKLKTSGKYISPDAVEIVDKEYKEKVTGEPVLVQWEKMSKSKHNGENPERLVDTYGCDTTKLLMLADVPPATPRNWSDATLPGVLNWQHRLWMTVREFLNYRNSDLLQCDNTITEEDFRKRELDIYNTKNYIIATATYHFKHTHKISVGISRLQTLTSTLRNRVPPVIIRNSKEFESALAALIIMLAPITPHFGSELWAGFLSARERVNIDSNDILWDRGVFEQSWPKVNDDYELSFQCKVDGADRGELKVKASLLNTMTENEAVDMMVKEESVAKRLSKGILKTKFDLYPDCRAILYIYTNRQQSKMKIAA